MSASFGTVVTAQGRAIHLAVHGAVDLTSAPALRSVIEGAIDSEVAEIMVDLSDVDFLDAAGVDALVEAQHAVRRFESQLEHECVVRVVEASRPAIVALLAAGVEGYLDITDDNFLIAI
jgi:anti-sigma B factor antagonist